MNKPLVLLLNSTFQFSDGYFADPETHEYKLFVEAEKNLKKYAASLAGRQKKHLAELAVDNGPSDVFLTVANSCYTSPIEKYSYKFCFLAEVKQDGTSLGTFAKWDAGHGSYKVKGGTKCYGQFDVDEQGRAVDLLRSGTVHFDCGELVEIKSVIENKVCDYDIVVATPLACRLPLVKRQLEELKGLWINARFVGWVFIRRL